MNTTDFIFEQIDKKRFKQSPNQWTDPTAYKIENEFDDVNVIPFPMETPPSDASVNARDILKQVKKKVSKKKHKDRLADKGVRLAERMGANPYK